MAKQHPRAAARRGAKIEDIIRRDAPAVLENMSLDAPALDELQAILDIEQINASIDEEIEAIYRRTRRTVGNQVTVIDAAGEKRVDELRKQYITVVRKEGFQKLRPDGLVAADAFEPRTDSPEETGYLEKVRQAIQTRGLWLKLSDTYPGWHVEVRLGIDGRIAGAADGRVTRDAVTRYAPLEGGYTIYQDIEKVREALRKVVENLRFKVSLQRGWHEQYMLQTSGGWRRPMAWTVELLGGIEDPPPTTIWDPPALWLDKTEELMKANKLYGAQARLAFATLLLNHAMREFRRYRDGFERGGDAAVTGLSMVATVSVTIFVALLWKCAVATSIGGTASVGSGGAALGNANTAKGTEAAVEAFIRALSRRYPGLAQEAAQVRVVTSPNAVGTVSRIRRNIGGWGVRDLYW